MNQTMNIIRLEMKRTNDDISTFNNDQKLGLRKEYVLLWDIFGKDVKNTKR